MSAQMNILVKKAKRSHMKIGEVIEDGTSFCTTGTDPWFGVIVRGYFKTQDKSYTLPELAKAHCTRVTPNHPKPTTGGSGFDWIKILSGKHRGKILINIYDSHNFA
jgi:hypothetical protein